MRYFRDFCKNSGHLEIPTWRVDSVAVDPVFRKLGSFQNSNRRRKNKEISIRRHFSPPADLRPRSAAFSRIFVLSSSPRESELPGNRLARRSFYEGLQIG